MQKYESWFSNNDSIITLDTSNTIVQKKDVLLSMNEENFFHSIESADVSLSYPMMALVRIESERKALYFEVNFELLSDCEDECCHCGDSIKDCYKHLDGSIDSHEWKYYLCGIFDSDGYALGIDEWRSNYYMWNPASIQDKDGFVNVRADRSKESKIVGQIKDDEVFFYTPSAVSDWWRVYSDYGQKFMGYVHKSRIKTYTKSSPEMKAKIEHIMR